MSAAKFDLTGKRRIEQGASYSKTFRLESNGQPIDLSNDIIKSSIRSSVIDTEDLIDFTVLISGPEGQYTLSLTAEQTASLSADEEAEYDVKWTRTALNTVVRLQEGKVEISGSVTKDEV